MSSQRGFTLIEMMIGLLIGSVVLYALHSFMQNLQSRQAMSLNRDAAMKSNRLLFELIKRDMTYQKTHAVSDEGHALGIRRKKLFVVGAPETTYDVRYRSSCRQIPNNPPEVRELLKRVYAGHNQKVFAETTLGCISSLACSQGTFPQIEIFLSEKGNGVPPYAKTLFPFVSEKINRESLGTALCIETVGDKLRIRAESVFLLDSKEASVRVMSGEIVLPKSVQTLDLLPD